MGYSNYFSGIVKVLESPLQTFERNQTISTTLRAELPQYRTKQFVILQFWGNLAHEISNYYNINDYILIEGYISTRNHLTTVGNEKNSKQVTITILKVYPLVLKSSLRITKS